MDYFGCYKVCLAGQYAQPAHGVAYGSWGQKPEGGKYAPGHDPGAYAGMADLADKGTGVVV